MKKPPQHSVRRAGTDDIADICDLGEQFFAESNFEGFRYSSPDLAYNLGFLIADGGGYVFVTECDGQITGFIGFDFRRVYATEHFSHLFLLYVHPDYRKSDAGRKLLAASQKHCISLKHKPTDKIRMYVSHAAAFEDGGKSDKSLVNLYMKYGFTPIGIVLYKDI